MILIVLIFLHFSHAEQNPKEKIDEFNLREFFDFSWLFTGTFQWHSKQMFSRSHDEQRHNFTSIFSYLVHQPSRGVLIDTKGDPFRSIFPPSPRSTHSFREICQRLKLTKHFYPCHLRPEEYPTTQFQPLITYGLYDVVIHRSSQPNSVVEHFDQLVYLFDLAAEPLTRILFVRHYLPCLIRLFLLVPQNSTILLPFSPRKIDFVRQYFSFLERRGVLPNRTHFVRLNREKTYHAHVVYSTSSPRFDLLLLHRILFDRFQTFQNDLIVVLRQSISDENFQKILQTIQIFQFPKHLEKLRVYPLESSSKFDLHEIRYVLSRALIVIGQSTDELSQIVWCRSSTHIVEIGRRNLSVEIFEISIQLDFHYWLTRTIDDDRLDSNDFRQLFLQLLTSIDDE